MIKQVCSSDYFINGSLVDKTKISENLKKQLVFKVQNIYEKISNNKKDSSSESHLQPSKNSLRKSIEKIEVNNKSIFMNDGQCRGASEWFIALLLKFKNTYPDIPVDSYILEIAKEFQDGVGIEGAILQQDQFNESYVNDLDFSIEDKKNFEYKYGDDILILLKKFIELDEGAYIFSFPGVKANSFSGGYGLIKDDEDINGHATAIFIERGKFYLFEPNLGLFKLDRNKKLDDLLKDLVLLLNVFDQYTPKARALSLFNQALEELPTVIDKDDVEQFRDAAMQLRKEKNGFLILLDLGAIFNFFEKRGKPFTDEQEIQLISLFFLNPVSIQYRLEQRTQPVLRKCSYLK